MNPGLSMSAKSELENLLKNIKLIMKSRKLGYKDLAEELDVSLSTVKRAFSKCDLSLDRLALICDWLDVSIHDVLKLSLENSNYLHRFTSSQESFFAKNPHYLAFIKMMKQGRDVLDIQKEFSLSEVSLTKYLLKLEEFGLVSYDTNNKPYLTIQGNVFFEDDGILGRYFSNHMIKEFADWATEDGFDKRCLEVMGVRLTQEQAREFNRDLSALFKFYHQLSNFNIDISQLKNLKAYTAMSILGEWDDPIYQRVINVDSIQDSFIN